MTEWFDANWTQQLEIALEVLIAAVLGGLIGFEREKARKPAGLRTHALLAAAASLLVGMTDVFLQQFPKEYHDGLLRVDPIRIVEAVVTGVAFIGAGTIFRHRDREVVEGLTTAASLLAVAAVSIAVALGQILLAFLITLLCLLILRGVGRMEKVVKN